jgi:hypothetical protein
VFTPGQVVFDQPETNDRTLQESGPKTFLLKNVEQFVYDDLSAGQRGFNRNVERHVQTIIEHFKETYPKRSEIV